MGIAKRKTEDAQNASDGKRGAVFNQWSAAFFIAGVVVASAFHLFTRSLAGGGVAEAGTSQPWGQLEITPLNLDRPEAAIRLGTTPAPLRWFFPGDSPATITALFESCDLASEHKAALLETNRWRRATNGWELRPSIEIVRALSPTAREKIYSVLATSPENPPQQLAFARRTEDFEEWFEDCELPEEKIALVRQLAYPKLDRMYFADIELFTHLASSNETYQLLQTLQRVPTLLVKLRVTPESDIEALVKYWSRGRNASEVRPLLQSLARVPGGASINISYFLPPVPRLRLYTYPDKAEAVRLDCFWTAFNFGGERAGYRFGDPAYSSRLLQTEYVPVRDGKQFGDLMLLLDAEQNAMHMCVYVADDIVFTKNGGDPHQPWVLMRLNDMMLLYASDRPHQWRVFRKRET